MQSSWERPAHVRDVGGEEGSRRNRAERNRDVVRGDTNRVMDVAGPTTGRDREKKMTLSLYGKSRRRQGSLLLLGVLAVFAAIVGGMSLYRSDPATAAPIVIVDDGGANDEVGQKDLNLLTVDYAGLPTTIAVGWNWDEPSVSGGNSLDACSLYDTDGDGNANYAVCGVAHFTGDPPVAAASTAVWSCSDNRDDRCTAPNAEIPSALSSCAIAVSNDDPFL